jgi:D-alanine-D-alanine ligase
VARVDLRMSPDGQIYVLEVNPLPGLTPGYSDLILISQAAGIDYDQLIAEIMVGGLKRLREKRREQREAEIEAAANRNGRAAGQKKPGEAADKDKKAAPARRPVAVTAQKGKANGIAAGANGSNGSSVGNGSSNGNGNNGNGNGVHNPANANNGTPAPGTPPGGPLDMGTTH